MTGPTPTPSPTPLLPVFRQQGPADPVPVVSVLVTTYNHQPYIARCLDRILGQVTGFPVEIIVRDDASTDGTPDILRDYARRFPHIVKLVLEMQNQHSRNIKGRPRLHALARGEFLAGCDGDDFWTDPYKLAKQVGFLRAHPDYVLSFHDAVEVDEGGRRVLKAQHLTDAARRDYSREDLRVLRWGWMLVGTMVFRNVPLSFPPEYALVPNGDNFLPMLLGAFGAARFQGEVGPLAYRQHGQSMWSSKTQQERLRMHLQSYLQIGAYFVRMGEPEAARAILGGRTAQFINEFLGIR